VNEQLGIKKGEKSKEIVNIKHMKSSQFQKYLARKRKSRSGENVLLRKGNSREMIMKRGEILYMSVEFPP
jgi:hypothetical protein